MRARSALAALALVAGSAEAQSVDTAVTRTDGARVTQLETINVTAERPRAAAPPVTTIEVAPRSSAGRSRRTPTTSSAAPAASRCTSRARGRASPRMP